MEIGTEILLKRIQDCPEEFADHGLEFVDDLQRALGNFGLVGRISGHILAP